MTTSKKLGLAYFLMIGSALLEGFWALHMQRSPLDFEARSFSDGTINAVCVLSYFGGYWLWINNRDKDKETDGSK